MKNKLELFIPISKVDAEKRLVYGVLTEEIPDSSGEILDYASAVPAFKAWSDAASDRSQGKSVGNLRAMHSSIAAGKFIDIMYDDKNKKIEGVAKVTDDNEWAKVLDGVYTGFSIGGSYDGKPWPDPVNPSLRRYTPRIAEVSIVDNPAVPTATFQMIKADGTVETRHFKEKTEMPQPQQVWQTADGKTFAKRDLALAHEEEIRIQEAVAKASSPARDALDELDAAVTKKSKKKDDKADDGKDGAKDGEEADKAAEGEQIDGDRDEQKETTDKDGKSADDGKSKKRKGKFKKSATSDELHKGLDSVARAACLIQELDWLCDCIEWEAEFEDDGSPQPGKLEGIIATLCEFLKDLVAEETAELVGDSDDVMKAMEAARDSLQKRGARVSKTDLEHMKKIHGHADAIHKCLGDMGYGKEDKNGDGVDDSAGQAEKSELADELQKSQAENAELRKAFEGTAETVKSLTERVQQIEATPVPGGPVAMVKATNNRHGDDIGSDPVEAKPFNQNGMSPIAARQMFSTNRSK